MSSLPLATFASLLRRYRLAAGLTQEELAERAHLSREAVGALERGDRRAPRKETFDLLAEALALTEPERTAFDAAARQQRVARPQASTPPTPSDTPAEVQIASLEVPHPPADGPLVSAGLPPPPVQGVSAAPPPHAFTLHGKRVIALVSGLIVLALLGGALVLPSATRVTGAGQHPRTLCLASDFPTTGGQARLGKPAENAVRLAVIQNHDLGSGYTLKFIPYNDAPTSGDGIDPQRGASNMTDIVQTPCILGMIGPLNSGDALAEMPIAANAGIVMISPATTNPGLTLRLYAQLEGQDFDTLHPAGKKTNFFSISPNDVIQGIVDADFAFDDLQARGVYVIDDHSLYGEGMAGGFTQGFLLRGGTIVGTESVPFGGVARIAELANRIVATRPDTVFYGGTTGGGGGLLMAQLVQDGYQGPLLGGDAIVGDPDFVQQAGVSANNLIFASLAVPDLSTFTSGAAAQFLRDYHARYPGQPVDGDSANAYDAAMVLITAMKNLIKAGQEVTRSALIDQVQTSTYTGVTGPISFDKNGDIAHGVYSIYTVQAGQWAYFQRVSI
jgi:branched-chain amino acid transport system substrate-binding protein